MRVPILENLVQEVETDKCVEYELIRALVTILLFLCDHRDSVVHSSTLWDLCDDELFYTVIVKKYQKDYGSPPLVQTILEGTAVWDCQFDTLSLREIVRSLLNSPPNL